MPKWSNPLDGGERAGFCGVRDQHRGAHAERNGWLKNEKNCARRFRAGAGENAPTDCPA